MRSLDKHIAKLARSRAKQIASEEAFAPELGAKEVEKILGKPKFLNEEYEVGGIVGVVTGLAWTEVGGDILYIESVLTPGKGRLSLTGNLGDVMKESATIAFEWVKGTFVRNWISIPRNSRSTTSTSTCPKAPFRKTARRPASRWSRRSSRPTRGAKSAIVSP